MQAFLKSIFNRPTFQQLTELYLSSPQFLALSLSSQVPYRRVIAHLGKRFGHHPVRSISRTDVELWLATRSSGAANDDLKKLRILFRSAIDRRWISADPTTGIRRHAAGEGHWSWTEGEIAQFEKRWPLGTRERLAFALLLYTGQRRGDVARMQWSDMAGSPPRLTIRQRKTGARLVLPIHPALASALEGHGPKAGPILCTSRGKPFSVAGFGLWMARKVEASGLPDHCVTHGLRKAAARRLAEAGCSAHEIASITGHRTLKEVERYTQAARQEHMAEQAFSKLSAAIALSRQALKP